jgi:hypothetical protein
LLSCRSSAANATKTEKQLNKPPQSKTGQAKKNRAIYEKTWKSLPLGQTARSGESFRVSPPLPILAKKGPEDAWGYDLSLHPEGRKDAR